MGHLLLFLEGIAVGLAIAMPVGPIGALCISRTLRHGTWIGLASGLGAACADAAYGAIAGFGVSSVAAFLVDFQDALRLLGGTFLLVLGVRILTREPAPEARQPAWGEARHAGAFASCFLLTLTNPTTILSFVAIFAGLGLVQEGLDYTGAASLVLGVFLGSALWWLALSAMVGLLRGRVTPAILVWVNRGSGAVITGFGIGVLLAAVL